MIIEVVVAVAVVVVVAVVAVVQITSLFAKAVYYSSMSGCV